MKDPNVVVEQFKQFDTTDELGAWGFSAERQLSRYPNAFFGRGQFDYWTPFTQIEEDRSPALGWEDAAHIASYAASKGCDMVGLGTTGYIGGIIPDPSTRNERETKFKQWLKPWVEDFDNEWGKLKKECEALIKPFKEADFSKYSDVALRRFLEFDCYQMCRRMWVIHFLGMYAANAGYVTLEKFLMDQIGINDSDPLFLAMVTGFENRFDEANRKMWNLAQRVKELGFEKVFLETPMNVLLSRRNESKKMQTLFEEIDAFLDTDGWRSESGHEFSATPWWDDPTSLLRNIVTYLKVTGEFPGDLKRRETSKKREEAVNTVRARLSTKESQRNFELLLPLAQKAGVYNEEHAFYVEHYEHTATYKLIKEIGKRFVEAGSLDEWTDVWQLLPEEIISSLVPRYQYNMRAIVRRRKAWQKARIEAEQAGRLPPLLGESVPVEDSIISKTVGVGVQVKAVRDADLTGLGGSSGVAEGVARVILDVDQLGEIQAGEILVCQFSFAPFASVFGIVSGVVADTGGMLSHAAICAREAGIPAVVLTYDGTKKIKTGQRIRVDGNKGAVYFLK